MSTRRLVAILCVISMLVLQTTCLTIRPAVAQNGGELTAIFIPVIINIYPNAGVTKQEARDSVQVASDILGQGSFSLIVVQVNDPPGDGNGDDGDGDFTLTELDDIQDFGGDELEDLPNQKGIKISFGRTPLVGSGTPGLSVHSNPTIIVRQRNTAQETGETIAHEIGHVMTLGVGHQIAPGVNANNGGHAPDQAGDHGNGNIMAPSDYRIGTHLTQDQIDEMREQMFVYGMCASQWDRAYPAEQDHAQFGTDFDRIGDSTGEWRIFDIRHVVMTSLHPTDRTGGDTANISARITVSGILPANVSIIVDYTLGFNIDGDDMTGMEHGGLDGVDRIVYVIARGNITNDTFDVMGRVYNVATGQTSQLPSEPAWIVEHRFVDLDELGVPVATSFLLDIPKELLSLSAVEVPVVATAGTPDDIIHDTTHAAGEEFIFDTRRWEDDPTLTTFGNGVPKPGGDYEFEVSGLKPNSEFFLYLNSKEVFNARLNNSGGYKGSFDFPEDQSIAVPNALTAQDSTGEFAYTITCPGEHDEENGDGDDFILLIAIAVIVFILLLLVIWIIMKKKSG